ncbi:helix-turn-helix domain-containing protein [Arachnia rubra]
MSQQQVAGLLGCSRKQVNEIVNGHAPHHRRHCFPAGERGRHPRRLVASL